MTLLIYNSIRLKLYTANNMVAKRRGVHTYTRTYGFLAPFWIVEKKLASAAMCSPPLQRSAERRQRRESLFSKKLWRGSISTAGCVRSRGELTLSFLCFFISGSTEERLMKVMIQKIKQCRMVIPQVLDVRINRYFLL